MKFEKVKIRDFFIELQHVMSYGFISLIKERGVKNMFIFYDQNHTM